MPLTVKLEGDKITINGTLDDPVLEARIKQIQEERGLETFEEAMSLCLKLGSEHMRFTEMPIQDGHHRGPTWETP